MVDGRKVSHAITTIIGQPAFELHVLTLSSFAHCSYEAGILEEADHPPPDDMWKMTDDPRNAPDAPEEFNIYFEKGLPAAVVLPGGAKVTDSVELFTVLNELGRKHGISLEDFPSCQNTKLM